MSLDAFYIYQLAWYVFGTAVGFAAAWFFWNKGIAEVEGRGVPMLRGMKLTGASGILVAVLLVIHVINPLKPLSDYDRLLLLHADAAVVLEDGTEDYKIELSDHAKLGLGQEVAVEMVPMRQVYSLIRDLEGAFTTAEPIPPGRYRLRIVDSQTGETQVYVVEVPRTEF